MTSTANSLLTKGHTMEIAIVGIAMFFNFAVVYWKFNNNKTTEGLVDVGVFAAIMYLSSFGGQGAMYVGTVASALFSIYLLFVPPKLFN